MKIDNTVSRIEVMKSREASHLCCLTRVNLLLKALRTKQDRSINARRAAEFPHGDADDQLLQTPSLHDVYASEIEGSFSSELKRERQYREVAIRFDSPREIARARLVFAVTLVIPLIVVSAGLALFEGQMGHAIASLLKFSALALAMPLILALATTAVRSGVQGTRARPALVLAGMVAMAGTGSSAYAMSMLPTGATAALSVSVACLLVIAVYLGNWLRLSRDPS